MLKRSLCRALAVGLAIAAAPAFAEDVITIDYAEPLRLLPSTADAAKAGASTAGAPATRSLRFDAFGRRFELNLTRNLSLVGDDMARHADVAWKGELAGLDDSWARISEIDGVPQGLVHDGDTLYAIELREGSDVPVIFRVEDLRIAPGALSCPTHAPGHVHTGEELVAEITAASRPQTFRAIGASRQIDVGVVADASFANAKGPNVEAALIARMNTVDGIFSSQLGLQFNATIEVFDDASDPFSDVTVAGDLLDELSTFRGNSQTQRQFGLTHLFTGRDLDGSTAGIAYLDLVCASFFGVSLTQGTFGTATESLIAAHEFGHNFGAPHDGERECAAEPDNQFLMAPRVSNNADFSACSISVISESIAEASCISQLSSTEVSLSALPDPEPALADTPVEVSFRALSAGTEPVAAATVTVPVSGGLTLQGVTSSAGQCTSSAGTAECTAVMLQPGSTMDVVVTVQASTAGTRRIAASVSSTDDEDAGNNDAEAQVVTRAAVDLTVAAASANATVDTRTTVTATVENVSDDDAETVTVTVTPGAELTLDDASWNGAGSCTVADNVATCDAARIGAGERTQLQLDFTGTAAGTRAYSVDVVTATTDINGANDSASGQITVSAVASTGTDGGGSGGGGNIDPWLLMLLSLLAATRGPGRAALR